MKRKNPLRVAFDSRLKLEFQDTKITSDGGLLACAELDDALGLTPTAALALTEGRRGKNIRHHLLGLLRQARRAVPQPSITARRGDRHPAVVHPGMTGR